MKKNFLKIVPVVILFIACTSPDAKGILKEENLSLKEDTSLRTELEKAYKEVRKIVDEKGSLEAFSSLFEWNDDPTLPPITDKEWPQFLNHLNVVYPDFNKINFVFIEQDDEYAYYYAWIETSDSTKLHVRNFVFHKTSQGWKLTGYTRVKHVQKAATNDGNNLIVHDLIPTLKKEVEETQKHK